MTSRMGRIFTLGVAAGMAVAPMAVAQSYPTKPVRIVTGSAGTSGELLSRYLSQRLNQQWGKVIRAAGIKAE